MLSAQKNIPNQKAKSRSKAGVAPTKIKAHVWLKYRADNNPVAAKWRMDTKRAMSAACKVHGISTPQIEVDRVLVEMGKITGVAHHELTTGRRLFAKQVAEGAPTVADHPKTRPVEVARVAAELRKNLEREFGHAMPDRMKGDLDLYLSAGSACFEYEMIKACDTEDTGMAFLSNARSYTEYHHVRHK